MIANATIVQTIRPGMTSTSGFVGEKVRAMFLDQDVAERPPRNELVEVIPGLMIWTIIAFGITFFVLRRYAFGPIQKLIDQRRDYIRDSIEQADNAREEARSLLEEHRKLVGQAKNEAEGILAEARKISDSQRERMRVEIEEDRQRRLEETTRQIEQATAAGPRRDPPRGREPLADRRREDHAQVADRRRPAAT